MKIRYKNILYFTLLCLFLFPPFVIRSIDLRLEVFPSVLLPSYASLTKVNKEKTIYLTRLFALDNDRNRQEIDRSAFFKGMPPHYSNYIIANNFGLDTNQIQNHRTGRFDIPYITISKISDEERNETKLWMRNRLIEMGFNDSLLIVGQKKLTISANRTFHMNKNIENDTVFKLH